MANALGGEGYEGVMGFVVTVVWSAQSQAADAHTAKKGADPPRTSQEDGWR